MFIVTRRTLFGGVGAAALASTAPAADASAVVVVDKNPNCGRCSGWVTR